MGTALVIHVARRGERPNFANGNAAKLTFTLVSPMFCTAGIASQPSGKPLV